MTGTPCEFILTKSLDLSLYCFYSFFYMYNYTVIDSLAENGYCEASNHLGGFNPRDA
jgi:hypothetical protein